MTTGMILSRAPTRIDFGGGWTDVERYAHGPAGVVVNAAITLHAYTTVRPRAEGGRAVQIASLDFDERVEAESAADLAYDGTLDLLKGAVKALDPGVGLDVETRSLAPPSSGLGTSAAACVALLAALNELGRKGRPPVQLAELACGIERDDLGILGGKQDQYASAMGGVGFMTFEGGRVTHQALRLDPNLLRELHRRLVLCYTGMARVSGDIHDRVWQAFTAGERETVEAIAELKRITHQMRRALMASDLAGLARRLSETWRQQKRLHPSVTNGQIDHLFEVASAHGSAGGKACGAGGGGCLVFLARPDGVHDLRRALAAEGAQLLEFEFDFHGVTTWPSPVN